METSKQDSVPSDFFLGVILRVQTEKMRDGDISQERVEQIIREEYEYTYKTPLQPSPADARC